MILNDREITELGLNGCIDPFDKGRVNPASYDVKLNGLIRTVPTGPALDVADVKSYTSLHTLPPEGYVMVPGEFLLACTEERVTLPNHLVGRVEGKSSLGRLGLAIHVTAGYIDPGFDGQITLEIANLLGRCIVIRPGMAIGQLAFHRMSAPSETPYRGRYQGSKGPVESRYRLKDGS